MRNRFLLLIATFALTSPVSAEVHWYMTGKTALSLQHMKNSTHDGTVSSGQIINGQADGEIYDRNTDDLSGVLGFALGREVGRWRFEGEVMWRYRTDWDLRINTHSLGNPTNLFGNVQTTTLMFNASRRSHFADRWSWEWGVSAGVARNDVDGEFVERGVAGGRSEFETSTSDSRTDFAWGASVGITRHRPGERAVSLRYRFVDLGKLQVGPFPQRAARFTASHAAHELQISFERGF